MANRNIVALGLFVAAISLKLPQALEERSIEPFLPDFPSIEASEPQPDASPSLTPIASPEPIVYQNPDQTEAQSDLIQIHSCDGERSRANFREFPSLDPSTILGEVKWGDSVRLKERVIRVDGVTWYEAIAPALAPSREPAAQNILEPGQTGWIAGCFVNNLNHN